MMLQKILRVGFLILLIAACKSTPKDNPALQEAARIHAEAAQIEQALQPQLKELIQRKNSINIQGRALTEEEIAFVEKVNAIENSYTYWEENHVEVPGYEHQHEENHHDHHHHKENLHLSPADMLSVQKEFRDSIVTLQQRVIELIQTIKKQ